MYSQFGEDNIIIEYFNSFVGNLLDIGANDGFTISNSKALIEKGWKADLIEPAAIPFKKLQSLYNSNSLVKLHNFAINTVSKKVDFYESSSLFSVNDSGLLSTIKENHICKEIVYSPTKEVYTTNFTKYLIDAISFLDFQQKAMYKSWDFISIDTEGCDWDILQQIDLTKVGCKCLCIEHNQSNIDNYKAYCNKHNLYSVYENNVNIILCKKKP